MSTTLNRLLLIAVAVVALILGLCPQAQASIGERITVHTDWGPYSCITLNDPSGTHTACGGSADAHYYANAGEWVGVDPVIGPNSWVSCYIAGPDNVAFFSDFGTAGDGHDINCLGTLNLGAGNSKMVI
jgi:hypothetical protein